jgi:hypothetical protein
MIAHFSFGQYLHREKWICTTEHFVTIDNLLNIVRRDPFAAMQ